MHGSVLFRFGSQAGCKEPPSKGQKKQKRPTTTQRFMEQLDGPSKAM